MVKHVAPHMIARKYGKIVNIGSGTVARGIPDFSHYVTSKGAVTAFTRCISRELGDHGICVNTLAPGYTLSDTGLTNTVHVEQSKAAAIQRRALKRDQFPEDLLGTLIYLCSSDSDFMTGQVLAVDGGANNTVISGQNRPSPANREYRLRRSRRYQFAAKIAMLRAINRICPAARARNSKENTMSVAATVDPKHNVTGNRQAYYDKISKKDMAPLWEVLRNVVTKEPKSKCAPNVWKFDEVKKLMLEAGDVISAEEAERRVLVLENPGAARPVAHHQQSLFAGVQLIMPGEIAEAHKHVSSAIRFVLDGEGAYTAVEGEKANMSRGDFILTPNWAPHDHGNPGKQPMMWLDVLDMPTVNHFETSFMEHFDEKAQNTTRQDGDSLERYGSGVLPDGTWTRSTKRSPIINYTYARTRPILERLKKAGDIDPRHGARVRYSNPVTGGHVMPTMGAYLALFPKGFKGKDYQSTDGTIFVCVEGNGYDQGRRQDAGMGPERRVRGAVVAQVRARREGRVGAVLDLRPAGAGSARHLAREAIDGSRYRSRSGAPRQAARICFAGPRRVRHSARR